MKLFQKKKNTYPNLILGILWLAYGVYRLISGNLNTWLSYTFILLSVFYLVLFFYFLKKPILIIENHQIIWNDLFRSKTIRINEIERVKKFAGDITIFSKKDKIKVNTNAFDKESVESLNTFLDKLDL